MVTVAIPWLANSLTRKSQLDEPSIESNRIGRGISANGIKDFKLNGHAAASRRRLSIKAWQGKGLLRHFQWSIVGRRNKIVSAVLFRGFYIGIRALNYASWDVRDLWVA